MQDKTITNALLALRAQIIRGNLDGLDHVNALLVARGIDPAAQVVRKPRSANRMPRRGLASVIMDCLRDGPKRSRDVARYLAEREPSVIYAQGMRRVYQGLYRLGRQGVAVKHGRSWRIKELPKYPFASS